MEKLTVYGQSPSLLFQFILSEFLTGYRQIKVINDGPLPEQPSEDDYSWLANAIATLTGGVMEEESPSPWLPTKGSLGKLRHYCQLYLPPSDAAMKLVTDLRLLVIDAFHSSLQAKEMLHEMRFPLDDHRRKSVIDQLRHLLNRLGRAMRHIAELLIELCYHNRKDENLLLMVTRHRGEFSELLGDEFVDELLTQEGHDHMIARYKERGFHNVIAQCKT